MSDSVRPHRRKPTSLPRPRDSPGKNTGVGCHFLLQCVKVKSESEVARSCLTLSDPMDCSLPGSAVHGIFQARVLERSAIPFSSVKCRRKENLQPRLLYLGKISFKIVGEIKSFTDKQKLREFSTPEPALQQTQEKGKTYKNKPKRIKKMPIGTYMSIITLNVNRLNAPTKRYRLMDIKTRSIYMLPTRGPLQT